MSDETFEVLLEKYREPVERFIHYKIQNSADADDVVQNTFLAAFRNFSSLRDPAAFKPWLLAIARNECNLHFRRKARTATVPLESVAEPSVSYRFSPDTGPFRDTLDRLPPATRELLTMYYVRELPQTEIARRLGIPPGTVKSRMAAARAQFRAACPPVVRKMYERGIIMNEQKNNFTAGFPLDAPEIVLTRTDKPFFAVDFPGILPTVVGERVAEGLYRYPHAKLDLVCHYRAERPCVICEAEGVKVCEDIYSVRRDRLTRNAQTHFIQKTDEYIRILGFMYGDEQIDGDFTEDGMVLHTFLDEGYNAVVNAEDPVRGNPVKLAERPAGVDENGDYLLEQPHIPYTTGVYDVNIGNDVCEAVGLVSVQPGGGVASEQYVSRAGKCILLRWYETWDSAMTSPNYESFRENIVKNRTIRVNGTEYVHVEDRLYK